MRCWYAVHTKPRCEALAEASLNHLGVEVFLPLVKERRMCCGKQGPKTVPMFPRYLFVRCEMSFQYRAIAYARGVKQFVSFGSGPAPVDEGIVEGIKSRGKNGVLELSESNFNTGQIVQIKAGPLHGLEAVFEREMAGAQRAMLLLKTISYQARLIVDTRLIANL